MGYELNEQGVQFLGNLLSGLIPGTQANTANKARKLQTQNALTTEEQKQQWLSSPEGQQYTKQAWQVPGQGFDVNNANIGHMNAQAESSKAQAGLFNTQNEGEKINNSWIDDINADRMLNSDVTRETALRNAAANEQQNANALTLGSQTNANQNRQFDIATQRENDLASHYNAMEKQASESAFLRNITELLGTTPRSIFVPDPQHKGKSIEQPNPVYQQLMQQYQQRLGIPQATTSTNVDPNEATAVQAVKALQGQPASVDTRSGGQQAGALIGKTARRIADNYDPRKLAERAIQTGLGVKRFGSDLIKGIQNPSPAPAPVKEPAVQMGPYMPQTPGPQSSINPQALQMMQQRYSNPELAQVDVNGVLKMIQTMLQQG